MLVPLFNTVKLSTLLVLINALEFLPHSSAADTTISIPATIVNQSSIAQYISNSSSFDGPMVAPINSSTYDWWYFDAVSLDHNYSVVAIFFTAPNTSFPFLHSAEDILAISFNVQTPEENVFWNTGAYGNGATITMTENDIQGIWNGTGSGFVGTNLTHYNVTFDAAAEMGITGYITMDSIAPAHYPCALAEEGANMELIPGVFWSNAVPDSQAIIDLNINGTNISFSGSGYHDKNWGNIPFTSSVSSWYWGHGRVGPYSLVWFDAIAANGTEYASGYLAKDGQVIGTSCSTNNVSVRPTGNSSYPPVEGSDPSGFVISIDVGEENGGVFEATVEAENFILDDISGLYWRWSGRSSGGFVDDCDETTYNGTALFEQFTLTSAGSDSS